MLSSNSYPLSEDFFLIRMRESQDEDFKFLVTNYDRSKSRVLAYDDRRPVDWYYNIQKNTIVILFDSSINDAQIQVSENGLPVIEFPMDDFSVINTKTENDE